MTTAPDATSCTRTSWSPAQVAISGWLLSPAARRQHSTAKHGASTTGWSMAVSATHSTAIQGLSLHQFAAQHAMWLQSMHQVRAGSGSACRRCRRLHCSAVGGERRQGTCTQCSDCRCCQGSQLRGRPPVVGMNLTQNMFAVCPVVVLTSGLLLCRSHRMMWVSSDPLASRDPVQTGYKKMARPQTWSWLSLAAQFCSCACFLNPWPAASLQGAG